MTDDDLVDEARTALAFYGHIPKVAAMLPPCRCGHPAKDHRAREWNEPQGNGQWIRRFKEGPRCDCGSCEEYSPSVDDCRALLTQLLKEPA